MQYFFTLSGYVLMQDVHIKGKNRKRPIHLMMELSLDKPSLMESDVDHGQVTVVTYENL